MRLHLHLLWLHLNLRLYLLHRLRLHLLHLLLRHIHRLHVLLRLEKTNKQTSTESEASQMSNQMQRRMSVRVRGCVWRTTCCMMMCVGWFCI